MIDVKNYLNDGANYKAQAVLAIIRGYRDEIAEVANHHESVMVNVGRFENCREQGYVFSLWYEYKFIKHYAVYEHRNSDNICVLINDQYTTNTPNADQMFGNRGKYDVDKTFPYNGIIDAADFIISEMQNEIRNVDYNNETSGKSN
jgi:hypothetical protein